MRRPFVPAALVAGATAPDVPYFLDALGVSESSPQDWYGPLLNATETHSLSVGLVVSLPLAIGLVAAYRMLRAPITALLPRLGPVMRWSVVTLLVAAPVLGGAVNSRDDFDAYRYVTEVDYRQPTTVDLGDGASETTYPSKTVQAPWGTLAEGVLTGAAKRAGASFTVALLLYSATWQIGAILRRPATVSSPAPSPQPTQDGK